MRPALLEPASAALAQAVRAEVYDSPLAKALEPAGVLPAQRGFRLRG